MRELDIEYMYSCTRAEPPAIPGVTTIRTPFDDNSGELPDLEMLVSAAALIVDLLDDGESVLVHCMYGLNRSSLLAAYAIAMRYPNMSGKEILALIRKSRPGALHNALFADAVSRLNIVAV
jgi:protein-tyrosine phosphatase